MSPTPKAPITLVKGKTTKSFPRVRLLLFYIQKQATQPE